MSYVMNIPQGIILGVVRVSEVVLVVLVMIVTSMLTRFSHWNPTKL